MMVEGPAVTREPIALGAPAQARSGLALTWRRLLRHRLAVVGGVGLLILVLFAGFGPSLTPYGSDAMDLANLQQAPSLAHPFGTDNLGRDEITRIMYGGRISLSVGLFSALIATVVGTLIGALAGYAGRWLDSVLMRLVDLVLSLPLLPLVIVISAITRPTVVKLIVVIGLFGWMVTARLVRGSFLALRAEEFTVAARVVGASPLRIVTRHLLPNAMAPIIVSATLSVASAIILESILSFLGMGVQPPTPSWGNMLQDAQSTMATKPWLAIFPGIFIFFAVICVNFLGDGLRDALDPRLRI